MKKSIVLMSIIFFNSTADSKVSSLVHLKQPQHIKNEPASQDNTAYQALVKKYGHFKARILYAIMLIVQGELQEEKKN